MLNLVASLKSHIKTVKMRSGHNGDSDDKRRQEEELRRQEQQIREMARATAQLKEENDRREKEAEIYNKLHEHCSKEK
uniref:Uncharacterized protein n=1 Tax=Panagrellus redivivus TaxID=6233 RepID=A0A7E4V910_PANRE